MAMERMCKCDFGNKPFKRNPDIHLYYSFTIFGHLFIELREKKLENVELVSIEMLDFRLQRTIEFCVL